MQIRPIAGKDLQRIAEIVRGVGNFNPVEIEMTTGLNRAILFQGIAWISLSLLTRRWETSGNTSPGTMTRSQRLPIS